MYAIDEDDSENVKEATDNEEDLLAWCLFEESDTGVVARGDQQTRKTKGEESPSSVIVECGEQSQFGPKENH